MSELSQELIVIIRRIANDIYLPDLRSITLLDLNRDANTIVRQILNRRLDADRILTLAEILLGQRLSTAITSVSPFLRNSTSRKNPVE